MVEVESNMSEAKYSAFKISKAQRRCKAESSAFRYEEDEDKTMADHWGFLVAAKHLQHPGIVSLAEST